MLVVVVYFIIIWVINSVACNLLDILDETGTFWMLYDWLFCGWIVLCCFVDLLLVVWICFDCLRLVWFTSLRLDVSCGSYCLVNVVLCEIGGVV